MTLFALFTVLLGLVSEVQTLEAAKQNSQLGDRQAVQYKQSNSDSSRVWERGYSTDITRNMQRCFWRMFQVLCSPMVFESLCDFPWDNFYSHCFFKGEKRKGKEDSKLHTSWNIPSSILSFSPPLLHHLPLHPVSTHSPKPMTSSMLEK